MLTKNVGTETIEISSARVQSFESLAEPICGGAEITSDLYSKYRWNRNGRPVDSFKFAKSCEEQWDAEFSYLGPVIPHFGHFMAEGAHRFLLAPAKMKCGDWLLVSSPPLGIRYFNDLPTWFKDALLYLGMFAEQVSILNKDVLIKTLNITAQSAQLGMPPSDVYVEALRELASQRFWGELPSKYNGNRIYVSRSVLTGQGNILGERYLESILQNEGYLIIRPETMSLRKQLAAYLDAEIIIFPEGSAIHGVELLGNNLKTVAVMCRRPDSRHIFESVLRKRAQNLMFLENPFEIGTVDVHPSNGRLLMERSQAMFSYDATCRFFRDHSLACLTSFKKDEYYKSSLDDLAIYVDASMKRHDVAHVADSDIKKLFFKFQEFISAGF